MSSGSSIQIVKSRDLDRDRWDACVQNDPGALIYSHSWYLDTMADDWYGMVIGDYDAVLPLPLKHRLGIRMVAMPPFVQRLGPAGVIDPQVRKEIPGVLNGFARLVQYACSDSSLWPGAFRKKRTDFVLPLDKDYAAISDRYTAECRKNVGKSNRRGCSLTNDLSINDVISLYRQAYGSRSAYSDRHFERLTRAVTIAGDRNGCHLAGVRAETGELVYAGLLLDDGRRLYYLLGAPTPKGRDMRATYYFIDAMIRRFAGSGRRFDFEGSDIPDVARFYRSFGPETEYYEQVYLNRYPFPLNRLIDLKLRQA